MEEIRWFSIIPEEQLKVEGISKIYMPDKAMISFETWTRICVENGIPKEKFVDTWRRMLYLELQENFDVRRKAGLSNVNPARLKE